MNTSMHSELETIFRGLHYVPLPSLKTLTKQPRDNIALMTVLWKVKRYSK